MATRSPEHAKVLMTRTLQGLAPATAHDAERLGGYGIGRDVEVIIWQRRSPAHHRLYWVVLSICVANQENRYGSADDLHSALKVALGYTHKIRLLIPSEHSTIAVKIRDILSRVLTVVAPLLSHTVTNAMVEAINETKKLESDCATITMPGSIAFDRMDQAEFKLFFEAAMNELRKAGYPVDEIIKEARNQLARVRTVSSQHTPCHDERPHVSQQEARAEPT